MSVPAHTNLPGFYFRPDEVVDNDSQWTNKDGSFSERRQRWVGRGHSSKSALIRGNRKYPTPYNREVVMVSEDEPRVISYDLWPGTDQWVKGRYSTYLSTELTGPSSMGFPWSDGAASNCESESITKALLRLNEEKVQIGTALAEAKQTLDMLAGATLTAGRALLAFKHGEFSRGFSIITGKNSPSFRREQANRWLQFQYGWKPLASDVYGAYNALIEDVAKPLLISASARSHHEWEGRAYDADAGFKILARTKLTGRLIDPYAQMMQSWGLINPLSVAWEVVPWSFAIDWFIPVGNTLAALTASAGLGYESGFTTFRGQGQWEWVGKAQPWETLESPGSYRVEMFKSTRFVHSHFPLARLYADRNPFRGTRAPNALALLMNLFFR